MQQSKRLAIDLGVRTIRLSAFALVMSTTALSSGEPPAHLNTSDSVNHGASVTLIGANFGTKDPADPYRYDNFEGGVPGEILTPEAAGGWYTFSYKNKTKPTYEDTVIRKPWTQSAYQDFYTKGSSSSYIGLRLLPEGTTRLYVSGWFNFEASYKSGGTPSRNAKVMTIQNDEGWQSRIDLYPKSLGGHHMYMLRDMSSNSLNNVVQSYAPKPDSTLVPDKQWHRLESFFDSDPGGDNARRNLVVDTKLVADSHGVTLLNHRDIDKVFIGHYYATDYTKATTDAGTSECFDNRLVNAVSWYNGLWNVCQETGYWGGATSAEPPKPWAKRYWDEVYVDVTPARVELGDAPTWEACTHREIQIPSAWTPSSLTFTANLGTFSPGDTAYIYVINEDEEVNASGYEVTIGSNGTDGSATDAQVGDASQADAGSDGPAPDSLPWDAQNGETDSSDPNAPGSGDSGCDCSTPSGVPSFWLLALGLLLFARRRPKL